MPRRCTAERTANSGFVSRLRLPCIDLRVPADEAQDSFPQATPTCGTIPAGGCWRRGACKVRVLELTSPDHDA